MSLLATVTSFLSTAGTFIAGAVAKVGPVVSSFAKNVISVVEKLDIEKVGHVVNVACEIVHSLCGILGINTEKNAEILGAKAKQADKTISEFDNDTEKYINYLKDEIELDNEQYEKMGTDEKFGCRVIGLSLETKAVEQRIGGIIITPESIVTLSKIKNGSELILTANDILNLIKGLKEANIIDMNAITDYLEGKGDSDRIKTGKVISEIVTNFENIEDSKRYIEDMKRAVRNFND